LNWARVKTILIIVFLVVNIFLFFEVSEKYSSKVIKPEEISDLKNLLVANDIILETTLPSQIKFLPRMKVTNRIIEENQTADKILGTNKWIVRSNAKDMPIYFSENKQLKYDKFGFIEYTINIGKDEASKLLSNEIKAKQTINNILSKYLKLEQYVQNEIKVNKTAIIIDYSYFNEKSEIFNNCIVAKILSEGKIVIKHGLIDYNGFTSKSKKVTPVDAIVELIRVLKDKGKTTIKEISIGYYAELNKANEIVRFGEADPAWKIKTDKGTFIFDAYTGILAASFLTE